jgi:hypothetical protein
MYTFEKPKRYQTMLVKVTGHNAGSLQVHLDEHTQDGWEPVCEVKLADGNYLLLKRELDPFSQ